MQLVLIESPWGHNDPDQIHRNLRYLRACMADCFARGEAPFASHGLYTQPGVLADEDPDDRIKGIEAGLQWGAKAEKTVIYTDRGISRGMAYGIENAIKAGRPIEYRSLGATWSLEHSHREVHLAPGKGWDPPV